jgi:osmotically-inducible protein OsmY
VVDRITVSEAAGTSGIRDPDDIDDPAIGDQAAAKAREGKAAATGAAESAGTVATDAAVTTAVKSKLLVDPAVGGLKIDVDTRGGIVTLSGMVSTRAEADQAVKLARATEGVDRVVDKLTVGR